MRIAAVLLILVMAAVPAVSHLIVVAFYRPRLDTPHARLQSLTPRIMADLKTLEAQPPFPQSTYQSDAQPYLGKYVSWEGTADTVAETDRVRDLLTRHLYWKTAPGELKALMAEPEFKALDTKWMEGLAQFDHWNLTTNAEIRARLQLMPARDGVGRIGVFSSLPMPNYIELRNWATLHVLKASAGGRAAQAIPVMRKAAELAHSSGTLVGHMIAVSLLKDEYTLKEVLKLDSWTPLPVELIEAYQRVSWAWVGVALETWRTGFPENLKPFLKPQFGACTSAWEAGFLGFQDFLEPRFPFETDFTANFTRARELHQELLQICRLPGLGGLWDRTPASAQASKESKLSHIPYLRRVLGLMLATVAVPDYYKIYDRKK